MTKLRFLYFEITHFYATNAANMTHPFNYVPASEALSIIKTGMRVFVHGGVCTPLYLLHELAKESDRLKNVELVSITVKGDIETMAFSLEKPSAGIIVNDSVKIEYTEKDGTLTASRVSKVILKNKEIKPPDAKAVSGKK